MPGKPKHDWSVLTMSVQNMSIDGDALPDFNMFDVTAVSHSAGGFLAIPWATVEPIVSRLFIICDGRRHDAHAE